MVEELEISWLKVIGITGLVFIIAGLIYWLIPNKSYGNLTSSTYITNINTMKETGFDYFKGSKLPTKIGESKQITLKEMLDKDLLLEFYDEKGKSCDINNSYIQVTKTIDNEYAMKVALKCDNKSDYFVTTIVEKGSNNATSLDKSSTNNANNTVNNNVSNKTNTNRKPNNQVSSSNQVVTSTNIKYINNCKDNECANNVYYTVRFDAAGGSNVLNQIVRLRDKVSYVSTNRDGYKFLGWYYNGVLYDFNTPVTSTISLVAKWQRIDGSNQNTTHVVRFVSNGGWVVNPITVLNNAKITEPYIYRNCYNFLGWYSDSNFNYRFNFNSLITKDITLYAKWQYNNNCSSNINMHKITYIYNNGMNTVTEQVINGSRAILPIEPAREGYNFLGWYNGDKIFNFDLPIYQDYVLEAKWETKGTKYHTYCAIEEKRYYSITYVKASTLVNGYDWSIKFDKLQNVSNLKLSSTGYLNNLTMYNNAYNNFIVNKETTMINGNNEYSVPGTTASMLSTYSLRSSNFDKYLGSPYYLDGNWYVDAIVRISNYDNLNSYYSPTVKDNIYFVPFYFDILYTNKDNCVDDLASNSGYYRNHEIVNTFYK